MTKNFMLFPDPHIPDFTVEKRTWKERLFTLPWKPWAAYKKVNGGIILSIGNDVFLCSPLTYEQACRAALATSLNKDYSDVNE